MSAGTMEAASSLIKFVETNIPKRSFILEFGSGKGTTGHLGNNYKLFSIEQNENFMGKYKSTYIHAPIKDGWYDVEKVNKLISGKKFDCIIVDGPAHGNRSGLLDNLQTLKLNTNTLWIFDDIDRDEDKTLALTMATLLSAPLVSHNNMWGFIDPSQRIKKK